MKMPGISLLEWQKRYGTEKACASALAKYRWPNGFVCPKCSHDSSYYIASRKVYQCTRCRNQVSVTAGTLFHSTNLPLVKWFWAIYLMASDKGGISALRLSKHIGVSWPTARSMLKKIRTAMADRDILYYLIADLIELDDTYIGGRRPGKRGRGAEGKKPVDQFASPGNRSGFSWLLIKRHSPHYGQAAYSFPWKRRNAVPSHGGPQGTCRCHSPGCR